MAPVQPAQNYTKSYRETTFCAVPHKTTSKNHQLIGSTTKILSLLAWNYSPARDAETGVPEYTSEALGIAEEVVELLVLCVKSDRNTA